MAMGGKRDHKLPEKCMKWTDFVDWAKARYQLSGRLLDSYNPDGQSEVDWVFSCGFFALVPNEGGISCSKVFHRPTGATQPLPMTSINISDVPERFLIEGNDSESTAELSDTTTGTTWKLGRLFNLSRPTDAQDTKAPSKAAPTPKPKAAPKASPIAAPPSVATTSVAGGDDVAADLPEADLGIPEDGAPPPGDGAPSRLPSIEAASSE
eukprot:CAMPEP_0113822274 /NCGR_PEP_ID=MMETSP0328-20130328/2159_1 /TAXON_ID=39455 /ORGANISM="Alexandrium minutum" /LENGTH=208 /DNA_ID=CAMNT_0000790211 /DNA_START=51 /DNA_END=677 /DNA_ORIENTATION=+ /assembly_acc=CAM_ASM_000350